MSVVPVRLPALKAWTRIGIEYDALGTFSLAFNGVPTASVAVPAASPGNVDVIIGAAYVKTGGTVMGVVEFDNVIATGK
jgi:hypothetical protein